MSRYYGDFAAGQTVRIEFCTVNPTTGAPVTLTSGAVQIVKNGSNATPSGGVTFTADAGSVVGRHTVTIATATDATTFSAGADYSVRLSAGTVAGVSVVGRVVGSFSLANRAVAPQTGDSYARLGVNGAALTDLPDPEGVTALLARLTELRAGYLENLQGGAVALASQIPDDFTDALFASAGVFSSGALTNAPTTTVDLSGVATASALGALTTTVGVAGAGLTGIPRTGYSLAADGLDAITTTEPTVAIDGPVSGWTFPQLLRWAVMRFMRAGKTPPGLTVRTLAGAVSTTQALTDDGAGTESTGAPT